MGRPETCRPVKATCCLISISRFGERQERVGKCRPLGGNPMRGRVPRSTAEDGRASNDEACISTKQPHEYKLEAWLCERIRSGSQSKLYEFEIKCDETTERNSPRKAMLHHTRPPARPASVAGIWQQRMCCCRLPGQGHPFR